MPTVFISGSVAFCSNDNLALQKIKSRVSTAFVFTKISWLYSTTKAEISAKILSISSFSFATNCAVSFVISTTDAGSINTVEPDADASCTIPLISPLCSAFTGITYLSPRIVTMGSCKNLEYELDVIKEFNVSRIREACAFIFLRIAKSAGLALSAISSSDIILSFISFSTFLRFVIVEAMPATDVSSLILSSSMYAFSLREVLRPEDSLQSSPIVITPPRSTREMEGVTSVILKPGAGPRLIKIPTASVVSRSCARTASESVEGSKAVIFSFTLSFWV